VTRETGAPRLEVQGGGERKTLRIRAPAAKSVELMGDITDWAPVRLHLVEPGLWETELELPPGVHRVNIRVDGGPWVAPGGTRVERTEFGGSVGILVVP
jgi:1,4-alpha-glucan branching enzyme